MPANPAMNGETCRIFLSLLLTLGLCACAPDPKKTPDPQQAVSAVRAVLEAQQRAWNRGDIDGFMDGYERADTTTFVSGAELTRGWQTVLDRYKRRYTSAAEMGTLSFSDLDIQPLDSGCILADGRWQLTRAADAPNGRFTLLFRNSAGNWRIVHDTTTSAAP
jgi:ketosteroid isomerase-like protein